MILKKSFMPGGKDGESVGLAGVDRGNCGNLATDEYSELALGT